MIGVCKPHNTCLTITIIGVCMPHNNNNSCNEASTNTRRNHSEHVQGNNELWLSLVLTHQAVFGLTGPQLAGLLGAILTGEVLKRPSVNWVAYPASPKVG